MFSSVDLQDYYSNLKESYRKIFFQCVKEAREIDNLERVWKEELKSGLENISSERKNYHCAGCGACCRFAVSEFSPDELRLKAQNGDNYASQFISTFIPYESIEQAREIFPEYLEMLESLTDGMFYIYHCPKVTEDNRCPDYENRPQICRDFPEINGFFLPKNCSFIPWKLKSLPVWLKINAMTEIMNWMKNL